jgi:GNAT superfamily N-acetyltransferase
MLEDLLHAIPSSESRFFRRESSDSERVERWCRQLDYRHYLPLLAWDGGRIAADCILELEPGLWTSHVGKFRTLVHPDYRRRGVATLLAREVIEIAPRLGLHKLVNESAAGQHANIEFLKGLGFVEQARLPEFIRDRTGRLHDMLLLVLDLPGE